jgi:DNA-binding LytR/AlgR family response regulator
MIQIAICDDGEEDVKRLSKALKVYDSSFEINAFSAGEKLIDACSETDFQMDILFLDIYMSGIDGIKVAQKIRGLRKDAKIVFVSSSKDHYSEAYEVFAFNYLLKPIDRNRLYSVLDRALDDIKKERQVKISFSYKSTVYSVACQDIEYLESRDKHIYFHMADGQTLQCYGKLDAMIKTLPAHIFTRCHQSFAVNNAHVTEMGSNYFRMKQVVIFISKKHLKSAKDQYYAFLFSHMGGGNPNE